MQPKKSPCRPATSQQDATEQNTHMVCLSGISENDTKRLPQTGPRNSVQVSQHPRTAVSPCEDPCTYQREASILLIKSISCVYTLLEFYTLGGKDLSSWTWTVPWPPNQHHLETSHHMITVAKHMYTMVFTNKPRVHTININLIVTHPVLSVTYSYVTHSMHASDMCTFQHIHSLTLINFIFEFCSILVIPLRKMLRSKCLDSGFFQ